MMRIFIAACFLAFSILGKTQIVVEVGYDCDGKDTKYTKKVLREYQFYLLIDNTQIQIEQPSDSIMYWPMLTNKQMKKVENEEYLNIRLSNHRHCFETTLLNVIYFNKKSRRKKKMDFCFSKGKDYFSLKSRIGHFFRSSKFGYSYYKKNMNRIFVDYLTTNNDGQYVWHSPEVYWCSIED